MFEQAVANLEITPEQHKVMRKLNRKIDTVHRIKFTGVFYRKRMDEYGCCTHDDFLTARGRKLIDGIDDLINELKDMHEDNLVWYWYCNKYNDGTTFDAGDVAA